MAIPKGNFGSCWKEWAGKSTTIKLILRLVKPDSGEASVFGTQSCKLTIKRKGADREFVLLTQALVISLIS